MFFVSKYGELATLFHLKVQFFFIYLFFLAWCLMRDQELLVTNLMCFLSYRLLIGFFELFGQ